MVGRFLLPSQLSRVGHFLVLNTNKNRNWEAIFIDGCTVCVVFIFDSCVAPHTHKAPDLGLRDVFFFNLQTISCRDPKRNMGSFQRRPVYSVIEKSTQVAPKTTGNCFKRMAKVDPRRRTASENIRNGELQLLCSRASLRRFRL